MDNHSDLEAKIEKKYHQKEKRKKGKMKVSGKSVLQLKKIISKKE